MPRTLSDEWDHMDSRWSNKPLRPVEIHNMRTGVAVQHGKPTDTAALAKSAEREREARR